MKKSVIFAILYMLVIMAFAKNTKPQNDIDDMLFQSEQSEQNVNAKDTLFTDDIIKVNFQKKDARLALLFSMIIPGSGQFYADKGVLGTYIFPVIEAGLIGGIFYFNAQGNDKTDKYKKFANGETVTQQYGNIVYTGTRYNRDYQIAVENLVSSVNVNDIYDNDYFRLDVLNSQHFYEDIGKYNKYIFGWADWYYQFAANPDGVMVLNTGIYGNSIQWSNSDSQLVQERHILGYSVIETHNPTSPIYVSSDDPSASPMRQQYITMRKDAEKEYAKASLMTAFIAFNHLLSGIDAVRVTHNKNRYFLSESNVQLNYYADMRDNKFTPMLGMNWKF